MYTHENGFRHEVEVGGVFSYGYKKFYTTEEESRDAAAHMALYQLVTHGKGPVHRQPCSEDCQSMVHEDDQWPLKEAKHDCGPVDVEGAALQSASPGSLPEDLQRIPHNAAVRALEERSRSIAAQEKSNSL